MVAVVLVTMTMMMIKMKMLILIAKISDFANSYLKVCHFQSFEYSES